MICLHQNLTDLCNKFVFECLIVPYVLRLELFLELNCGSVFFKLLTCNGLGTELDAEVNQAAESGF